MGRSSGKGEVRDEAEWDSKTPQEVDRAALQTRLLQAVQRPALFSPRCGSDRQVHNRHNTDTAEAASSTNQIPVQVTHLLPPFSAISCQEEIHIGAVVGVQRTQKSRVASAETPTSRAVVMMVKSCLMSSDASWLIRDKLWPMPKHGSIILYVHGNQKAR